MNIESGKGYRPSFGQIKTSEYAKTFIKENFSRNDLKQFNKLVKKEEKNPVDVFVKVGEYSYEGENAHALCIPGIIAKVKDKIFTAKETLNRNISPIKMASKYADGLSTGIK